MGKRYIVALSEPEQQYLKNFMITGDGPDLGQIAHIS